MSDVDERKRRMRLCFTVEFPSGSNVIGRTFYEWREAAEFASHYQQDDPIIFASAPIAWFKDGHLWREAP